MTEKVWLTECPRDAMQGFAHHIPTDIKVRYLNKLLEVGYETIDMGSFVSPKAIPQMADTADVLERIDTSNTNSKLSVIVANERGARDAVRFGQITYLGYPFSISETFQQRNTNSSIAESLERVKAICDIAGESNKEIMLYISMGFGNPYGDPYEPQIAEEWVGKLSELGIQRFSLADTIGAAKPDVIQYLFKQLIPAFPELTIGAHFHTAPHNWKEKVESAFESGCRYFDSAIFGFGGCPMAKDELIGNMPTEHLVNIFSKELGEEFSMNAFEDALRLAQIAFSGD